MHTGKYLHRGRAECRPGGGRGAPCPSLDPLQPPRHWEATAHQGAEVRFSPPLHPGLDPQLPGAWVLESEGTVRRLQSPSSEPTLHPQIQPNPQTRGSVHSVPGKEPFHQHRAMGTRLCPAAWPCITAVHAAQPLPVWPRICTEGQTPDAWRASGAGQGCWCREKPSPQKARGAVREQPHRHPSGSPSAACPQGA